jgi:hypothetical protein
MNVRTFCSRIICGFLLLGSAPTFGEEIAVPSKTSGQLASSDMSESSDEAKLPETEARGSQEEDILLDKLDDRKEAAEKRPPPFIFAPEARKVLDLVHRIKSIILLYASLRLNVTNEDGSTGLNDGASRVGFIFKKSFSNDNELFARSEGGINIVDQFENFTNKDSSAGERDAGSTLTPRLYYAGYRRNQFRALAGKNWSAYYDVAGLTDRFAVYGGTSMGVYNANTDGGASGTGRADHVAQIRYRGEMWHLALQGQTDTEIPGFESKFDYDYGVGLSAMQILKIGLGYGAAFNLAAPQRITPEMKNSGFTGDDRSATVALRYMRDRFLAVSTVGYFENHEADEEGVYFDAFGWEVYSRIDPLPRLRIVAGVNYLWPDDDDYLGSLVKRQLIAGFHYTFWRNTFDDMLYLEILSDRGVNATGEDQRSSVTAGVRVKLEW